MLVIAMLVIPPGSIEMVGKKGLPGPMELSCLNIPSVRFRFSISLYSSVGRMTRGSESASFTLDLSEVDLDLRHG